MANPITTISQASTDLENVPVGALFENVYYDDKHNFTLKNLHDYVVNTSYVYVGPETPTNDIVKIWYQTSN